MHALDLEANQFVGIHMEVNSQNVVNAMGIVVTIFQVAGKEISFGHVSTIKRDHWVRVLPGADSKASSGGQCIYGLTA